MHCKISSIINQKNIICNAKLDNKTEVLQYISNLFCEQAPNLSQSTILNHLLEREQLGSTVIGHGVAIPHCRTNDLEYPIACMVALENSIDFDTKQSVKLIFGLVVPEDNHKEHLELIAQLAELLNNNTIRDKLLLAKNSQELFEIIKWNY